MHSAYEATPVLERLPLAIESIACYGDLDEDEKRETLSHKIPQITLLVGTKIGHLLVYKVTGAQRGTTQGLEVVLERSNRSFAKKPILQLFVTPEVNLIISLSDGLVSVHDLHSYQLITVLSKSKGANLFSADLESQVSSTGDAAYALKLCVASKRKLQLYFWKNKDFIELHSDINLQEVPRVISWCRDSICVGMKREFFLVKLNEEHPVKELFPTGKVMEPVVGRIGADVLVLMKDERSVFINDDGEAVFKSTFSWSDNPVAICSQQPYLIAVMAKYIEVRTLEPRLFIQNIDLVKPRIITTFRDWVFISSTNNIWCLRQNPVPSQISELVKSKEFELALRLAKMPYDDSAKERESRVKKIEILLAFELFCQKRFDESLRSFAKLSTDPAQVIGLFPDLLPNEFRHKLDYPSQPPNLKGVELENGLLALIEFLTQKRNETLKLTGQAIDDVRPIVPGNEVIKSKRTLLQIIDTTLLKCYLKTNDALVAPLLRLPDNFCHVEEAERMLKKNNKFRELTELYRRRGLHRKALNLLLSETHKTKSDYDVVIGYLQHLNKDDIDLIFHFAQPIIEQSPAQGLKIFTADTAEIESYPKDKVINFLDGISIDLVEKYLEHLVYNCDETTQAFHNRLAIVYKDRVLELMTEHHDELPEDERCMDRQQTAELIEAESKLLSFLEVSTSYEPQRILLDFPPNKLLEERAIILGRQGSHEQALNIYTNDLRDNMKAEDYCKRAYAESPERNKDVFLCLLKMYLQPSSHDSSKQHNLLAALKILYQHSNKIDPVQVLKILPTTVSISSIEFFIRHRLEEQSEKRHQLQLLGSLVLSESLQVHEQRMQFENRKCLVTDERVCRVCRKKIGDSAFARYPNDVIVHYFCCKDRRVFPVAH